MREDAFQKEAVTITLTVAEGSEVEFVLRSVIEELEKAKQNAGSLQVVADRLKRILADAAKKHTKGRNIQ